MRLYICPICGARLIGYTFEKNNRNWCNKCLHEIIPLATPQETEGVKENGTSQMHKV